MKKIAKILSLFSLALFLMLSLGSCDNKIEIYRDFNNNGSSLAKNHVYYKVKVDKIISILNNDKKTNDENNNVDPIYTYVFYGTASDTESQTAIQIYNEQAKQFGIETIYFIDSNLKTKDFNKMRERFNMARPKHIPTILVFIDGDLVFDSSVIKLENKAYEELATTAFRDTKKQVDE